MPSIILTISRTQAPALPESGGCWPVADLTFMNPPHWRERGSVEQDETLLQPVAYGVLFNRAGELWCYQRTGGDARLNGSCSCGVGGHVDESDGQTPPIDASACPDQCMPAFDPGAILRRAWLRELSEELQNEPLTLSEPRIHGLVYEGLSPIGRVHLGVLCSARWTDANPPQPRAGEALQALGFLPLIRIVDDPRFELWSRLVARFFLDHPHLLGVAPPQPA